MPQLELTVMRPGSTAVKVDLIETVITMGRSSDCVVPIEDQFLSRRHAEIVADPEGWVLRDAGSANGTFLNGARVTSTVKISSGDRIHFGNTEVLVGAVREKEPVARDEAAPLTQFFLAEKDVVDSVERDRIIHRLALELIADRSMSELFEFILDRVVDLMQPSRAALALLNDDGSARIVNIRRTVRDDAELTISRTLLREVVRDRKVLAFTDMGSDDILANAKSIVAQSIYSALCAPLIAGNSVLGVLYVDYQMSRRVITEDDAQLAAQIARVAAMKLESTRLRDAALEKGLLDETIRVAQTIQMRMLPQNVPQLTSASTFDIAAALRAAKQVGGDFYDFHVTDGKLYFSIGDVSGKGIPAALMMAVTRALFRSFTLAGKGPADVLAAVNRQLCEETEDEMFVTAFCGVLDLRSGAIRYANAGHNPPITITADVHVQQLPARPGLVLGYIPSFQFVEETATLRPGDVIYLYTDGITEAANESDELFSVERLEAILLRSATLDAKGIADATLADVATFVGNAPQSDDLTLLCIRYIRALD